MKKRLFIIPLSCLMLCGIGSSNYIQVKAEGEDTTIIEEETPVVEEETTPTTDEEIEALKQEWQNKLNEFKDQYVVPLVSGVSIASILNLIITLAYTVIKNKTIKAKDKLIEASNGKMEEMISAQKIFCDKVANMILELETSNQINKDTLKEVQTTYTEFVEKMADLTGKTEDMQKIIPVLNTLSLIQAKTVETSEFAIKSGVADDVNTLMQQLKELNSEDK